MKHFCSKSNVSSSDLTSKTCSDFEDRAPCWYANYNKNDETWSVGCKYDGKTYECFIKLSKSMNLGNDGLLLAKKLISLYKSGGDFEIKQWVKSKYN